MKRTNKKEEVTLQQFNRFLREADDILNGVEVKKSLKKKSRR